VTIIAKIGSLYNNLPGRVKSAWFMIQPKTTIRGINWNWSKNWEHCKQQWNEWI